MPPKVAGAHQKRRADTHAQDVTAMVAPLMDHPGRLAPVRKQLPESVLCRAQDPVVTQHVQEHPGEDAPVSGCGVDLHANALEVMLSRPVEVLDSRLREEHLGVPVHVTYGVCTSPRAGAEAPTCQPGS